MEPSEVSIIRMPGRTDGVRGARASGERGDGRMRNRARRTRISQNEPNLGARRSRKLDERTQLRKSDEGENVTNEPRLGLSTIPNHAERTQSSGRIVANHAERTQPPSAAITRLTERTQPPGRTVANRAERTLPRSPANTKRDERTQPADPANTKRDERTQAQGPASAKLAERSQPGNQIRLNQTIRKFGSCRPS